MRKTILTLFVAFAAIPTFAQKGQDKISLPIDSTTQKYAYTRVIEVPGKNAAELYKTIKEWSKVKYTSDKFLIDDENARLTDAGNFTINITMKGSLVKIPYTYTVNFNISTFFKDGKAKVEITDIKLGATQTIESYEKQGNDIGTGKKFMQQQIHDTFEAINTNMLKLLDEIDKTLKGEVAKKSEW